MSFDKALIVDDESDTCFLLAGILKQQKINALFVHSLDEAKSALKKYDPNLIFLDNHLQDGLGMEFLPVLVQKYPKSKIIFITAFDSTEDRKSALAKGAHYFLGKPFTRNNVLNALKSVSEG